MPSPYQIKRVCLITGLLFWRLSCIGQINEGISILNILEKEIIGQEFTFGEWTKKGGEEIHLTYLGKVITAKRELKVITSSLYWGLSKRATSRILFYNSDNQYLGQYRLGLVCELPKKLDKGFLIFSKEECTACSSKNKLEINLNEVLPQSFFWECKDGLGDIFRFSSK